MTWKIGDILTQEEINGIISVFCNYYEHHESFEYSDEVIELETCDVEILNGIYSDEELIVENHLNVKISEERFPNQNYFLAFDYFSYIPDTDDELPVLKHDYFELVLDRDNVAKIDFGDVDVVYIMLENWDLITKFNKPVLIERGSL